MFSSNRSRTNCTWRVSVLERAGCLEGAKLLSKGIHLDETKQSVFLPKVYCMNFFRDTLKVTRNFTQIQIHNWLHKFKFTTGCREQHGARVGYYFRAKHLCDMDLSFLPVVLRRPKGLQLQDVSVMALGRVTYRQETPCTQQIWNWVPFSEIHKAEGRRG